MLKFAYLPEFKEEVARLKSIGIDPTPKFSHGTSYGSMCIDMHTVGNQVFGNGGYQSIGYVTDHGAVKASYQIKATTQSHPFPSILPYAILNTGIVFQLEPGLHLTWGGRSGLAFKNGRLPFEGRIDAPYRGEVKALIYSLNPFDLEEEITSGTKIAQLEVVDYRRDSDRFIYEESAARFLGNIEDPYSLVEVDYSEIDMETERGTNGFGSTGI